MKAELDDRRAPVGLVIIGAGGRMGGELLRLLPEFPSLRLVCAAGSPGHGGRIAAGVPLAAGLPDTLEGVGLVLDFSSAAAAPDHVMHCANAGWPLLLGTTGLGPEVTGLVDEAAGRIPILVAPNTSLGATALASLVRQAAAALGPEFKVRVGDIHHKGKRDAPSGTALSLGAAIQEGGGSRDRPVEYLSIREGDAVGEHEVGFQGNGEWLRLSHGVTDRAVFARGALQAGSWLARQGPGRYRMADVIEEK